MRRNSKVERKGFKFYGRKEKRKTLSAYVGSGGITCGWKLGRVVGYGSLGLIALMAFVMLFPTTNNSHAAIEDEFSSNVHTDIKSYVRSTIALSITGQVNLDLTPKSSGTFSAETAKLSVSTNNVSGYSVYLAMVDGSSNSLLPMNTRSEEEIKATPETMTAENYTSFLNTWGYRVGGSAGYKAVPTAASTPIIAESSSTKEASYDLSFAVAVGTDLPAGIYGNQVLVSTVANPIEVRGINDITYMQEMTSDICTVSFENETKQLIDTRDGKSYWVAKLKDGNCWMTQNLALDIALDNEGNAAALSENGTKVTLDESNSDMSGKWGSESQYPPAETATVAEVSTDDYATKSWKLSPKGVLEYYYQFNTIAAGTAESIVDKVDYVKETLCPKAWTLPITGFSYLESLGPNFIDLLNSYNIPEYDNTDYVETILSPPLNFTMPGFVNTNEGGGYLQGYDSIGDYWSSGRYGNGSASGVFMIQKASITPRHTSAWHVGLSVRCVAR